MLGRGPNGYSGDVKEQTRLTLGNLRAALNAAGLDFKDVVETMVYLTDIRYFQAMNEVSRDGVSPFPAANGGPAQPLNSRSSARCEVRSAEAHGSTARVSGAASISPSDSKLAHFEWR
jgi:enamine deaminase RidA (YjgF/YER057c/UK114 family)